jgi:hypothetical protein
MTRITLIKGFFAADKALMRTAFLSLAVIVLFSMTSGAEERNVASLAPETIKRTFLRGTDEAKEKLAASLNLRGKVENAATCTWFQTVQLNYPVLEPSQEYAALVLRSEQCWFDFVVILRHKAPKDWELVETYPVFCKHGHSPISFPSLLKQGQQEIMINRDNLVSGTGFWQFNTTIIRFQDQRPDIIFDEIQELNFFVLDPRGGNTQEAERGSFFIVPSDDPSIALSDILEKQVIVRHKQRIVRWRIFSWDVQMNRFRSQPLDDLSASGALKKQGSTKN